MEGAPTMCGWGGNGWMWNGGGWGWGGGVMYIVLALLLVAVVVVVAFAIRDLVRGGSQHKGASSVATGPEDTLAHRFARGEIAEDEYRRRVTILREQHEHV
jgi:putative membrane protein